MAKAILFLNEAGNEAVYALSFHVPSHPGRRLFLLSVVSFSAGNGFCNRNHAVPGTALFCIEFLLQALGLFF